MSEEDKNLPYLYWIPNLHKTPFEHRFIAGSSKCTTKDLSRLFTKLLSTIKDGLIRYCTSKTSNNRVRLRMPVVVTRLFGCPYSYIPPDIRLFNIVYLHHTQIALRTDSKNRTSHGRPPARLRQTLTFVLKIREEKRPKTE